MMNEILVIAGRRPFPLDDGWKIRTFFLLKSLSTFETAVDLLVFDETGASSECKELEALCRELVVVPREKTYSPVDLLRGLLFKTPFSVLNYADSAFARAFDTLVARHDYGYVQVEDIVMAQYVNKMTGARKILDMHNIESALLKRYADNTNSFFKGLYARIAASKLEKYEMRVSETFDAVLVCSSDEKNKLQQKGLKTFVEVIPNGVDSSFYAGLSDAPKEEALVFVGSMDYHANISGVQFFISNVLPILRKSRPKLKVYVVGKNSPAEIVAQSDETLVVTGAVDDVRPYLGLGCISIVPLQVGGGTRLKILEAMAARLPVISTSLGAEGIGVRHGENILIADTATDFAAQVMRLLENPLERKDLAANGMAFALENYDWSVVASRLKARVENLLGENRPSKRGASDKLKVLFISYYIDDPSVPGFGPKYERLSTRWEGDVFHLAPEDGDYKAGDFTFRGCKYLRTNVVARQWRYLMFCLRKAKELGPYDVIISYDPQICGFISLLLKKRLSAKLLVEVNTDHFHKLPTATNGFMDSLVWWVKKTMMRLTFKNADAAKFVNSHLASSYGSYFNLSDGHLKQDTFFSYIATQAFSPVAGEREHTILMVGHPYIVKGADVLIRAFNIISKKYPNITLKIIGMCNNLDDYQKLIENDANVVFLPGVSHKEIASHFQNCLFYVLSSRTEGIPRVLIEAMACGKAVIGSKVGGVPDVILDQETGLLFESENSSDLAEKMMMLLDDPPLRKRLGEAGLERSRTAFSPEAYVSRYFEFMDKIIGTSLS